MLALSAEESERRFKEKEAAEKRVKEELEKLKKSNATAFDELTAAKAELQERNDELAAKLRAFEEKAEEDRSKSQEREAQRKTEVARTALADEN